MLTLYRPLEAQSFAGWGRAQLMGPGLQGEAEAGVRVTKGDTRTNPWKGNLRKLWNQRGTSWGYALSLS